MKKHISIVVVALIALHSFAADEIKSILKPSNKAESWRLEQHEGAKATIKAEGDGVTVDVTNSTGTDWHVQANMTDLDLKDGKEYKVRVIAKAAADRTIQLTAMIDKDDWHSIGLAEPLELTKEWKTFEFTFKAENVAAEKKNRAGFFLGADKGAVMLKEFTLSEK